MSKYPATPELSETDKLRFFAAGKPSSKGCILWQLSKTKRGYGIICIRRYGSINRRVYRAHRVAYRIAHGVDPVDHCVCHTCDNPSCVNPSHLFLGTHTDNMRDMTAKGRHGAHTDPSRLSRGEQHGMAKLRENDVREIRDIYARGETSQAALGRKFNISQTVVGQIVRRERWKSVA